MGRAIHTVNKPRAVDLFCGCGAVTQGLKSRFRVVAAVDNDPVAADTYRSNHKNVHLFEEDINVLDPVKILNAIGYKYIDLLVVCAPCQPFSSQNQSRYPDKRSNLILQAIRYAEILKPELIFFENVKGLTSPRNATIINKLKAKLIMQGYTFWVGPTEVDAADYSVPQRRKRCVMICSLHKGRIPAIPKKVTPEGRRLTVEDAIGDVSPLSSGEASKTDSMHFARSHSPIALERFKYIRKDGGSRFDLPNKLVLTCHMDHDGHPDVYGRMAWRDVAPTLTTGCTDVTRGRYIHPRDDRAITLREAARLQTFPDRYKFTGSPQAIARQIGNAVPVKMVRAFSKNIANALVSSPKEK